MASAFVRLWATVIRMFRLARIAANRFTYSRREARASQKQKLLRKYRDRSVALVRSKRKEVRVDESGAEKPCPEGFLRKYVDDSDIQTTSQEQYRSGDDYQQ